MAETNEKPQPQLAIQRIYVKDLSFEAPSSPSVFLEKWEPQVTIDLNSQAQRINEGVYEVVLSLTVTAKAGDKTAYLVEVQQAGIFSLTGFTDAELGVVLGSHCPGALFPYAREVVSDLVTRGTFPQLVLTPINFDALYARHQQQKAAAAHKDNDPAKH
ncbi:MAG: protein-export chaperone SecB [Thiohalomonadaceae bacterium]